MPVGERIYTFKDGRETIFDAEDVALICQFNLQINPCGYVTIQKTIEGKHIQFLLHRYILNVKKGEFVDHINGDPLDNRRVNLRLCTKLQNMWNRRKPKTNNPTSRFKGVERTKDTWYARLRVNYKRIYIGPFKDEVSAAIAYNEAAIKHRGEFAKINIIN